MYEVPSTRQDKLEKIIINLRDEIEFVHKLENIFIFARGNRCGRLHSSKSKELM